MKPYSYGAAICAEMGVLGYAACPITPYLVIQEKIILVIVVINIAHHMS